MIPGAVHPFRPSADRARCADCSLGADQHALETLLEASIDATARPIPAAPAEPPSGRGSQWTRAQREAAGMPLCRTPGCSRAPTYGRRGLCRRCYEASPDVRKRADGRGGPRKMRDPVSILFFAERADRDRLQARAKADRVSASELVRRALLEALSRGG